MSKSCKTRKVKNDRMCCQKVSKDDGSQTSVSIFHDSIIGNSNVTKGNSSATKGSSTSMEDRLKSIDSFRDSMSSCAAVSADLVSAAPVSVEHSRTPSSHPREERRLSPKAMKFGCMHRVVMRPKDFHR